MFLYALAFFFFAGCDSKPSTPDGACFEPVFEDPEMCYVEKTKEDCYAPLSGNDGGGARYWLENYSCADFCWENPDGSWNECEDWPYTEAEDIEGCYNLEEETWYLQGDEKCTPCEEEDSCYSGNEDITCSDNIWIYDDVYAC